jgi:aryl-alcohol dehydrogenase-like predicted oxidoreductase
VRIAPVSGSAARSGTFVLGGDLPVHRLGFGAMRITGTGVWGEPPDRTAAMAVLHRAVELGITLIDTADSYGPEVSERLIAEALHPYPPNLVIATKAGFDRPGPDRWTMNGRPAHLRAACEGSLRRLKLERIDLYQLHRIDPAVPLEDQIGTLTQLQADGKIRHIGLSEVRVADIERARRLARIVSVQNRYNVADRHYEDVVDYCDRAGIALLPWFPLATGHLARPARPLARVAARFPWFPRATGGGARTQSRLLRIAERLDATPAQVALAWLLRRSPVMLPIPGTGSVTHLEENVGAALLQLGEQDYRELAGTRVG